nr:hypothetical protein [Tanacetum cinerariifolium]
MRHWSSTDLKEAQDRLQVELMNKVKTKDQRSLHQITRYCMKNQRLRAEHRINQKIVELKLIFSGETPLGGDCLILEEESVTPNDSCVTKFLKEVNSRGKVPSNKSTKRNKQIEKISVPNEQERQIPIGHRFSIQKTSVVQKKTMTPGSCLRWKLTGKIFKTVDLRWVPTGKIFASSTTKVDSEPLNGSNADITNQYECEQTLDVSACTLKLS